MSKEESPEVKFLKVVNRPQSPRPSYPPRFEVDEKVLGYYLGQLFEAKILETEYQHDLHIYFYYVHYTRWNKKWDEWVPETTLEKYTDENLQKQKELQKELQENPDKNVAKRVSLKKHATLKRSSVASDTAVGVVSDTKPGKNAKTRRRDTTEKSNAVGSSTSPDIIESEEEGEHHKMSIPVCILLPVELRTVLGDDYNYVVRQQRLVKFPVRHTVSDILENYLETRSEQDLQADILCNGIRECFNRIIGEQLLYLNERTQFNTIMQRKSDDSPKNETDDPDMCDIYGFSHLLRLITKLDQSLSYITSDVEAVNILQDSVNPLLIFLVDNHGTYFSVDDYNVSDEIQVIEVIN